MNGIFFQMDERAFFFAAFGSIAFYFLSRLKANFSEPYLLFSDQNHLQKTIRSYWGFLPCWLYRFTLAAFLFAWIDPHLLIDMRKGRNDHPLTENQQPPKEGIAIYLILDQSGSMQEEISYQNALGLRENISKINLVKKLTYQFITGDPELNLQGRPNDLIGLIFFARAAQVMSPLTLDHSALLKQLQKFNHVQDSSQDGTSIGYAIFKTTHLIAATKHYAQELIKKGDPAYTIKNSIIILITDGLQDPNPLDKGKRLRNMDVAEAADYAKEQGIRLYIINVEPKLSTEEFAPYRHIMQKAAESTGGQFFMADAKGNLGKIYRQIDQIEKTVLPESLTAIQKKLRPDLFRRLSLYPYLIAAGLISLLIGLGLEATVLRKIP